MKNSKLQWTGRSYGGRFGNYCFALLLRGGMLPAYALLVFVSAFFMFFRRVQCAESSLYLQRVFKRKVSPISIDCYRHLFSFGMSILDKYAYFAGRKIECEDLCKDKILDARKDGKGVIVVVSHIGGWALAGGELARYGCPTGVIGLSREHKYIEDMARKHTVRQFPEMIASADEPLSVVAAVSLLRKNGVLAVHGDRYVGGKFAKATLLGEEVRMPVSAYALASKTGAKLLYVFCVRERMGKYKMFSSEAVNVPNLRGWQFDTTMSEFTQRYADNIECLLNDYPYQWYNFYPFWNQ